MYKGLVGGYGILESIKNYLITYTMYAYSLKAVDRSHSYILFLHGSNMDIYFLLQVCLFYHTDDRLYF